MLKKLQSSIVHSNRIGILTAVCGIAIMASACGGVAVNSTDSTPSTGTEATSPTEQSMEVPTENPAALPQASGADLDICSLITAGDAEAVMGQPVVSINPFSEIDQDYGETVFSCYYMGKDLTVVVSTVDLGTAQAAGEAMQQQLSKEQTDNKDVIINEEPGLGEKAYWTVVENAGIYTFLKGEKIIIVGLVGNIGDATSHKAPLLALAKSVSAKY
jgi:hypothetical protein